MNPLVDEFLEKSGPWKEPYLRLRAIALGCGLTETLKWGVPCYTARGANIALIHGFRDYCAILFVKGALLKDEKKILITQTENTQSQRQVRFTTAAEVEALEDTLRAYILEAIEVERAGLKVSFKPTSEFRMPEEFRRALDADPALEKAFDALTPGRQRAYLLHFSAPVQALTRESRIRKASPEILAGRGLNER